MPKETLVTRLKGAFKAFQMRFSGSGGGWWGSNNNSWRTTGFAGTDIDYVAAAGDLTKSSLVMAAVNWVGTILPEAALTVSRKKTVKVSEPVEDHPMVMLLEQPNKFFSGELLWKAFAVSWLLDGNVYFHKVRNKFGQVIQLWYIPHFMIKPRWPADGTVFIAFYEYEVDGKRYAIPTEDIIHFRYGIDPYNPRLGLSPAGSVLREIYGDNERATYSALMMRHGGVPPWVVGPEDASVDLDKDELKGELMRRLQGDERVKPIVFDFPFKIQELAWSPDKMMPTELSKTAEERVAAAFGIPKLVLGFEGDSAIYSNMRSAQEHAWANFVVPTQRLIAAELRAQLLPDFETKPERFKVWFDISNVRALQEDRNELVAREVRAYAAGIKTRAECRAALGFESKPEDEIYFIEAESVRMDREERHALAIAELQAEREQERLQLQAKPEDDFVDAEVEDEELIRSPRNFMRNSPPHTNGNGAHKNK